MPSENAVESVTPAGTVVLSDWIPHVASVTLGVWVRTGSRHEGPGEEGLSHFLEHMFFKGTARRTARQIAEELDAVGGHLDASTGREVTCFYARVLAENLPMACDVLCDQLLNSAFRDEDIGKERDVVIEEIRSYEDEPAEVVMDSLLKTFYGEHPLALPVLGDRKVIGALDRATLAGYRDRHYTADNIIVAAAGNVRHAELADLMSPLLSGLPASGDRRRIFPPDPRPRRTVIVRKQEQVHLALAAPSIPFNHPDRFVLQVLNNILGGGVSSRLFQEIREKRGLTYGISSGVEAFLDGGALLIHTAADPEKFKETADAIVGILEDMSRGEITDPEIIRGRDQLKGNIFLALESTSNRMSRMASSKIYLDRVTPLAEVMRMVAAVGPEDVRSMARNLLRPGRFALAVLGPGTAEQYQWPAEKVPAPA